MFMFEFEDGCFWIVTLGAKSPTCETSNTPRSLSLSVVNAVIAIGVSCRDCSRRCAVTMTSSRALARASWAEAGRAMPPVAAMARASALARNRGPDA